MKKVCDFKSVFSATQALIGIVLFVPGQFAFAKATIVIHKKSTIEDVRVQFEKTMKAVDASQILGIWDIDGTLTMAGDPLQNPGVIEQRAAACDLVAKTYANGVTHVGSSAWPVFAGTLHRISEVRLASVFGLPQQLPVYQSDAYNYGVDGAGFKANRIFLSDKSSVEVAFAHLGNVATVRDLSIPWNFYRQKALAPYMVFGADQTNQFKEIIFADDSISNITAFFNDVSRFDLYPNATVHLFELIPGDLDRSGIRPLLLEKRKVLHAPPGGLVVEEEEVVEETKNVSSAFSAMAISHSDQAAPIESKVKSAVVSQDEDENAQQEYQEIRVIPIQSKNEAHIVLKNEPIGSAVYWPSSRFAGHFGFLIKTPNVNLSSVETATESAVMLTQAQLSEKLALNFGIPRVIQAKDKNEALALISEPREPMGSKVYWPSSRFAGKFGFLKKTAELVQKNFVGALENDVLLLNQADLSKYLE